MMPLFFVTLLVGGLQHPLVAAGLGVFYAVARFFYFKGYATGIPDNRLKIGYVSFCEFSYSRFILCAVLVIKLSL